MKKRDRNKNRKWFNNTAVCISVCVADVILIFVGGKWLYFSRRAENNMKQFNGILSIFYATLNEKKTYQMIYFVLDFLFLSLNRLVSLVL